MSQIMQDHAPAASQHAATCVTVADLGARDGVNLAVQADIVEDAPLMSGSFLHHDLGCGLTLHGGDVLEEQAFDVHSSIGEGLSCIFFLNGQVETEIGGKSFSFRADSQNSVRAVTLMNTNTESFARRSPYRQRVTHLVVNATPGWLAEHAHDATDGLTLTRKLSAENLNEHRWIVPQQLLGLIGNLIASPAHPTSLQRLHIEAQAIQVLADSLDHTIRDVAGNDTGRSQSTKCGSRSLQHAKDFIASHACDDISVALIAKEAAISISGLQTLFRQKEGCGVFEYVRRVRLDRARTALMQDEICINEASRIAGYNHPANFATAFRKRFAISPSQIARDRPPRGSA